MYKFRPDPYLACDNDEITGAGHNIAMGQCMLQRANHGSSDTIIFYGGRKWRDHWQAFAFWI